MRSRLFSVPLVATLAVVLMAFAAPRGRRDVQIVSACTPSGNPGVQPERRSMTRQDSVFWTVAGNGGDVASYQITPKDPDNWPFSGSISGTPSSPAASSLPSTAAPSGQPFAYNVHITCSDGSTQTIDPEIIIEN